MKKLLHLVLNFSELHEIPARIAEQWADGFNVHAQRIGEKGRKSIPDEARYQSKLVGTSTKKFKEVISADFVSKAGLTAKMIVTKHATNLGKSYKKYHDKLAKVYETVDGITAKKFKEAVTNSKEHFARGLASTITLTGTRVEGRGITSVVGNWLTATNIADGLLTGGDELIVGKPMLITPQEHAGAFRLVINYRLLQSGSIIMKSEYDESIMKMYNDQTNDLVQRFVDADLDLMPFETGGKSHIDYVIGPDAKPFRLEILVTQK
jgi:hypothetical protein